MKALIVLLAVPVCFAQRSVGFGNVAHPGAVSSISARPGQPVRRASRTYAYPVYVGGVYSGSSYGYSSPYYGDSSGYGYAPQSQQQPVNVTVINAPPQVPTVVINQHFGPQPQLPEEAASPAEVADAPPPPHYFLVAFKDHSVYSALTYWVEDKTLHYVTPQQTHNQASIDLVDMDFTNKLNQR